MATIPYQPTYTTDPKYGLRYGPSQFAPTQGQAGAGSASAKPVPTAMTTGAGGYSVADPFINEPAFQPPQPSVMSPVPQQEQYATPVESGVNPTATYGGIDVSNNSTIGFRTQQAGGGMAPPPVIENPYDYTPAKTQPRVADPFAGLSGFSDGAGEQLAFDNSGVAQQYGYTPTEPSVAGLMGFVPGGSLISGALGLGDNYGADGTYDSQGNVFSGGRAYDPITGRPAQSFSSNNAYYDNLKDSYGSLRDAGEGMLSSGLGSYGDSIYAYSEGLDISKNADGTYKNLDDVASARARRDSGMGGSNVVTTASLIQDNMRGGPETEDGTRKGVPVNITAEMLGFQGNRIGEPTNITGKYGFGTGDIVNTGNKGEFGVITVNKDGTRSIQTPSGNLFQVEDINGDKIQVNTKDALQQAKLSAHLARQSDDPDLKAEANQQIKVVNNTIKTAKSYGINTNNKSLAQLNENITTEKTKIVHERAKKFGIDINGKTLSQINNEYKAEAENRRQTAIEEERKRAEQRRNIMISNSYGDDSGNGGGDGGAAGFGTDFSGVGDQSKGSGWGGV